MKTKHSFLSILIIFILLTLCACADGVIEQISSIDSPRSGLQTDSSESFLAEDALRVSYIDVGQGDSILIQSGKDVMLIDAGPADSSEAVTDYLTSQNVSEISYLVATHAHEDHIGGMPPVIMQFPVKTVIMPNVQTNTATFENLLDTVAAQGLQITTPVPGETLRIGRSQVTLLAPLKPYQDNLNDSSVVLRLDHGEHAFLFMGDAESVVENDLMAAGLPLEADVLKVSHHGSKYASKNAFLKASAPEYAVISVGRDNSYGHPSQEALQSLTNNGSHIYRTDQDGTIVFSSDGKNISIYTVQSPEKQTAKDTGTSLTDTNPFTVTTQAIASQAGKQNTPQSEEYIGNKNSKKFHLPSCSPLPLAKNRVLFQTREEAIEAGYEACGSCNP